MEPTKVTSTWTNRRTGEARIAKRLDHLLISKYFLEKTIRILEWVSIGGNYDHNPMRLELASAQGNPPKPIKLKLGWMKEEDFVNKIKETWKLFDDSLNE
jgi:hypothetical protein